MSNVTISGNPSGTATFTVQSPATNTNRTLTLPDTTATLTAQGTALTLATAQASTSGTSIDFTGIPSWAKRVTVMFLGVSISGTSNILVQLGTSSGVVTTGYASSATTGTTTLTSTAGFAVTVSSAAADLISGACTIPNISGNSWVSTGAVYPTSSSNIRNSAGSVTLSGTLDRVRITTVNGTDTFDAGTVNIMWEG